MASQSSLLENIESNPSLANFLKVIKAIGGSETLNSPQQLTVWAPLNMTSAQADSVIAVYQQGVAQGLKLEDNKAITQFMQNHVALYARNVSSLTNDTVAMLNGKYMKLVGTSASTGSLAKMDGTDANNFNDKIICNNGILYTTEHTQTFFPNVREYLEQSSSMDSIVNFITKYDEYTLDEKASVAGGIVDGKTVYLDSVTNLSNMLLAKYGYIQREDSVYTLVAPTDKVWEEEYEKYSKYYVYDPTVMNADSLTEINTRSRILEGRVFNTSPDWHYNIHPSDSLCNTQYHEFQSHYPRQNVYYNPLGANGILNGLKKVECSNGYIYIDDKGVIDPRTTFFGRKDFPGTYNYEIAKNSNNEETMKVSVQTLQMYEDSAMTVRSQSYRYAEVTAKTSAAQTEIEYTLPGTLSGCYYNIYMVTVPGDNHLPAWMTIQYMQKNAKGVFPTSYDAKSYFNNPDPVTAESGVENSDVILKQSNSQRIFVSNPYAVDTILVQSGVQFSFSGYGLSDGVVKVKVNSVGPSSSASREKIYTRTLRINEFILVPFETKEEAEEAQYNKDAFNDKILEANK